VHAYGSVCLAVTPGAVLLGAALRSCYPSIRRRGEGLRIEFRLFFFTYRFPGVKSVADQVSPYLAEEGSACSLARLISFHGGGRLESLEAVRDNQADIAAWPRGGGSPEDGGAGEGSCFVIASVSRALLICRHS
jgi:hypothetical protein